MLNNSFVFSEDIIYWPVIYYLNTYGNSAINNWSGEEMEVDGGSILANQIIAGRKESGINRFTGVALGEVEDEEVIYSGMYGYNNGINTFGLRSDGTAYFGMGKNIQINGEGKTAIQVGDIEIENNEIQGNGFLVDFDGNVYLSGTIHATKGNIGGWEISEEGLEGTFVGEAGTEEEIKLSPNEIRLPEITINNKAYGIKGYISGQFGNSSSPILKMWADKNILIESEEYIRLTAHNDLHLEGKDVYIAGEQIYVTIDGKKTTLQKYIQNLIPSIPSGGEGNAANE